MKNLIRISISFILLFFIYNDNSFSLSLGSQITIYDGVGSIQEDQEVEPGMNTTYSNWDLEGFFLKNTTLSVVGQYDFINGASGFTSGDIFIDVDGDRRLPSKNSDEYDTIPTNLGYDYVINLKKTGSILTTAYDVINLTTGDPIELTSAYYKQNINSNPWEYVSGGEFVESGSFTYHEGLSSSEAGGFEGEKHNVMTGIDLSFLAGKDFTVHYTMGCGNDNLMGASPVPEPATMALFGIGLLGIAGFTRKKLQ